MVDVNFGRKRPTSVVAIDRVNELRAMTLGPRVRIGAGVTYTRLLRDGAGSVALAEASRTVGSPQIRNAGTLGGNLATSSPAGDTLPVLAVLEAMLVLASDGGERRVPFNSFYTGYRRSVLRADELIAAVEVPHLAGRQWFRKVGTRAAQAISKVVMAGIRRGEPRVSLGSVAATVVRLPRTEAALASGAPIAEARRALEEEIQPIDDLRSTAEYRRRVSGNLLEQFWSETA